MQIGICGHGELVRGRSCFYGHAVIMTEQVHWLPTQSNCCYEVALAKSQQEELGEFGRDKKRLICDLG